MGVSAVNETTKPDRPKLVYARAELTLARDDAFPLRRVPLKPDPLEGLVAACAMLEPAQHDGIEITLDLVPMTPAATRHWRASHVADKTAEETNGGWKADLATALWGSSGTGTRGGTGGPSGTRVYGLMRADKRRDERMLSEALANHEPHFEFQLLIRTRSESRGRAVALLQATLAAMNQFDGDNSLRAVGSRRFVGLRFAGADSIWRRRQFDRRIDNWRFVKRPNSIIGTSEVAGLLKPATASCRGDRILRSEGSLSRPPNNLVTYNFECPPNNTFLIGAIGGGLSAERYVAAPLEDSFFSYSPGKSRWGKTESNLVRFCELARSGTCSTLFLDPHADALARVKPYLAELGCADRIIELSIASGDGNSQVGWNPLAKSNLVGDDAIGKQAQLVTDSIAAAIGWTGGRAPRALTYLQVAVISLLELSAKLPDALSPTIFQLTTLLTSESWRDQVIPHLSRRRQHFWLEQFNGDRDATGPITNIIERLDGIQSVKALLGSSMSTYNLRTAIDSNKIILVRLRGTGETDKLIASLVVYDLMKAVMGRTDIDPEKRIPVHAWLDEVQEYDGAVKAQIAALLEQTAKYGMRLHLLNQDPRALQERTLSALLNNRSHMLATAVQDPKSASRLADAMDRTMGPDVVSAVRQYHGIAQTTIAGEQSDPYRYRSIGLEEAYGPQPGTNTSNEQLQALKPIPDNKQSTKHRSPQSALLPIRATASGPNHEVTSSDHSVADHVQERGTSHIGKARDVDDPSTAHACCTPRSKPEPLPQRARQGRRRRPHRTRLPKSQR